MKTLAFILFLSPILTFGQFSISGRVIGQSDKKPIAYASVFLSNTQAGARTADNGAFSITNVKPGQYDLVITIVGYETYHQPVQVNADMALGDIVINPKTVQLHEVKIMPDAEKARLFAMFKRLLLGNSPFAGQCKILNPDAVYISYDSFARVLTASSDDFIEIENDGLGYKIKYLLSDFTNDERQHTLYFAGSALFEELKGSKRQQRVWNKNRREAYEGSSMHFLRSVLGNDVYEQGFKVLRLIRAKNPDYIPGGTKPEYKETLITKPLGITDYTKKTEAPGLYALNFNDCLYIMYSSAQNAMPYTSVVKSGDPPPEYLNNWMTTTVIFEKPYAIFDLNGIFIDPASVIFEGNWGTSRMADLLPVDYEPSSK